jgi:hypothetical protein
MSRRFVIIRRPRKQEPVLWVVDSEQWPRACLRAELIERGYNPYGYLDIRDALDALFNGRSPRPEAIILELRGQNLSEEVVQALRNLQIPTILLGGSLELNDPLIQQENWEFVFKRPVSLGQIADAVPHLIGQRHPSHSATNTASN